MSTPINWPKLEHEVTVRLAALRRTDEELENIAGVNATQMRCDLVVPICELLVRFCTAVRIDDDEPGDEPFTVERARSAKIAIEEVEIQHLEPEQPREPAPPAPERIYYNVEDADDPAVEEPEDALDSYLDRGPEGWTGALRLTAFRAEPITERWREYRADRLAEGLLEDLDDAYRVHDGEFEPDDLEAFTVAKSKARELVDAVAEVYEVTSLERAPEHDLVATVSDEGEYEIRSASE